MGEDKSIYILNSACVSYCNVLQASHQALVAIGTTRQKPSVNEQVALS